MRVLRQLGLFFGGQGLVAGSRGSGFISSEKDAKVPKLPSKHRKCTSLDNSYRDLISSWPMYHTLNNFGAAGRRPPSPR
jgi:hypothetical protein